MARPQTIDSDAAKYHLLQAKSSQTDLGVHWSGLQIRKSQTLLQARPPAVPEALAECIYVFIFLRSLGLFAAVGVYERLLTSGSFTCGLHENSSPLGLEFFS